MLIFYKLALTARATTEVTQWVSRYASLAALMEPKNIRAVFKREGISLTKEEISRVTIEYIGGAICY